MTNQNTTETLTPVIFRLLKGEEVMAVFPSELADDEGRIRYYRHVGQHGAAQYDDLVRGTRLASESEYATLKDELEHVIGYNLKIVKKQTPQMRTRVNNEATALRREMTRS